MASPYEALLTVLESGSFSGAARIMGYTQSAVSQMVKTLEERLGVTLLLRSRTGAELTREGEALLPDIREMANAERKLSDHAAALRGLEQGAVHIGAFPSVSGSLLPPAIKRFKEAHPGIRFALHQGLYPEMEDMVREGVVDFSFTDLARPTEQEEELLYTDAYVVVLPEDHPLTALERIPLRFLSEEPFILLEEGRGGGTLTEFLKAHSELNVQYRVADDYGVLNMVENHLGVAILPEVLLQRTDYRVEARPLDPPLMRSVGIIYRRKSGLSTAAEAFVRALREMLQEQDSLQI